MCPCGVIAVTVTLAVEGPGSARNRPAVLPDGGTPGTTSRVDGAAVPGSQLVTPWDSAETSAATRPMLVCTSMASTPDPRATDDRDSVTVWCGGTVIPLSLPAATWPPSLMTLTSTLAAVESTFIRSSWTCDPPFCCPGPRNHRSEPGSAHRDRKSTRLNSSHVEISYAVFCLKKKKKNRDCGRFEKNKHRDEDIEHIQHAYIALLLYQ